MHIWLIIIIVIAIIFCPMLWTKYVLQKYSTHKENYPGNGLDFAKHLVDYYKLFNVGVVTTDKGDHYDPIEKKVRLSKEIGSKKSLTAVVVAAHEVGHAIQDRENYKPFQARINLIKTAQKFEKAGIILMIGMPVVTLFTRVPASGAVMFLIGLMSLGIPVAIHIATLFVELDASFNRAMPILIEGRYISENEIPQVRRILKACALTYIASSLASLLNFVRWFRVLGR